MKKFHICTIANRLEQYEQMKTSFFEAGFDENQCRYSLFDNSKSNIHDPYKTFNIIQKNTDEPYIIFCHQDILLNQGYGFDQLVRILDDLEMLDPKWALVGNAGFNNHYELVAKITDPRTPNWTGSFPKKIHSLDENFLVIKTSTNIACSQDLDGFHFYATDLCLNAIQDRRTCYVIDFHLTHLSSGNFNQAFDEAQERFYKKWCSKFNFCYVRTPCSTIMLLSKYRLLRYLGSRSRIKNLLINNQYMNFFAAPYW